MQLPGRLSATTLGDLLGALHRERAQGSLEIVEQTGRTHRVFLAAGLVTAVELDRASPTLAEVLQREIDLDDDVLRRSLLRALAQRRLHGEVLVRDFLLSPEVIGRALRTQLALRLGALERLSDCELRFRVAVRAPREALAPALGPEDFLHGRRRKRDLPLPGAEGGTRDGARGARLHETLEQRAARRVLGVAAFAGPDDIKQAYRALVRRTHPDLHPRATAEERRALGQRFSEVTRAYQTLVA